MIASGGAGTLEYFCEGVVEGNATALLAESVFHFRTFTVAEVKEFLADRGYRSGDSRGFRVARGR